MAALLVGLYELTYICKVDMSFNLFIFKSIQFKLLLLMYRITASNNYSSKKCIRIIYRQGDLVPNIPLLISGVSSCEVSGPFHEFSSTPQIIKLIDKLVLQLNSSTMGEHYKIMKRKTVLTSSC